MTARHLPVGKRLLHILLAGVLPILLLTTMILYVHDQVAADDEGPEWVKKEKVDGETSVLPPTTPLFTTPSAQFCSAPELDIPDNDPDGIFDTLSITQTGTITDLNVIVQIDHTWVGDLEVMLEHVSSGITATLIDRPGFPTTTSGCPYDNIDVRLNDEGLEGDVETSCSITPPAISGNLVAGDPPNASLLAQFDGESISGDWVLHVTDHANLDTGSLMQWCLDYRDAVNNGMPVAVDDEYVVVQNLTRTVAAPGVLANDSDPDGDALTAVLIQPPLTGTLDLQPDGSFTYTPMQDFTGTVTFSYQAFDDVFLSDPALVTLTVTIPTSPAIQVIPDNLSSTQRIGTQMTKVLTIHNLGTLDLIWEIGTGPGITYSNGPLVNFPGAGSNGADVSAWQNQTLSMTTSGFGHQASSGYRVADEFTVTDSIGWLIDTATFFAYQTGSSTNSTITAVNYRIWDGPPNDPGSQIIFGDTSTNRLINTEWSGIYRTAENNLQNTDRPLMANTVATGVFLPVGTYWLDWQSDGSLQSGPWVPPITISGEDTTGNALQFNNDWLALFDGGSGTPQGLPFFVEATLSDCAVPDWLQIIPDSGMTGPLSATAVDVIFDSTGLTAGTYEAVFCVTSNDVLNPIIRVPVTMVVTNPDISLSKTVGTEPGVCADSDTVYVNAGTAVYYCYRVTNNGNITFTLHDLEDSAFGDVLTGYPALLPPGGTITAPIVSTNITATTVNTATWTAYNVGGLDETESVAVATAVLAQPAIALTVSAHTAADVCHPTPSPIIPIGRRAYYCYQITNVGNVPLYTHTLTDSVLGDILTSTVYTLAPGAGFNNYSIGLTIFNDIFTSTTHIATWTALSSGVIKTTSTTTLNLIAIRVYFVWGPLIYRP